MKLLKRLHIVKSKKGHKMYYGLFLCKYCLKEVKKQLSQGKRQKSCGCMREKLISKALTKQKQPIFRHNHLDLDTRWLSEFDDKLIR